MPPICLQKQAVMQPLNLPPYAAPLKEEKGKQYIFDPIRKKWVVLTPEEWVRQHFLNFMRQLGYPEGLTAVERLVVVNGLRQRSDVLLYNRQGKPALIVECKAPHIPINQTTLSQAARYNIPLKVGWLVLTNGLQHYCLRLNAEGRHEVLKEMPDFETINATPVG